MKNKNRVLGAVVIVATIILIAALIISRFVAPMLSAPSPELVDSAGIHVNPVDGLRPDFIMGADVSMLAQMEASGAVFYVNGKQKDCLTILKDQGVNWIRLRIWNDPTDASGQPLGGETTTWSKQSRLPNARKRWG